MSVRALAEILLERLRADDLQGFEDRLTDPLAAQALDYNDGLVFHLACDNKNIGFTRATLPHTLPRYIGKELTYCIASRNTELFETLLHSHTEIFDHIHPNTLHLLAQRCVGVHKTPNPQYIERDMLFVLLNTAPEHVIHKQLQQMHTSNASVDAIAVVDSVVAQRQKELLEHEIEERGLMGVGRKM